MATMQSDSLIHANRPEAARTRAEFLLAGRGPAVGDSALAGALTALAFVAWDEARIADAIGLLRAAAERAGFRPCLRCRPELAPGTSAVSMEEALFTAIRARAIQGDSVDEVAKHAGFSARQLRRSR